MAGGRETWKGISAGAVYQYKNVTTRFIKGTTRNTHLRQTSQTLILLMWLSGGRSDDDDADDNYSITKMVNAML